MLRNRQANMTMPPDRAAPQVETSKIKNLEIQPFLKKKNNNKASMKPSWLSENI